MEDLSRNLSQGSQVKSPGHTHKEPRRWTVILIGDLGKIVSFQVGKPLVLGLAACLSAILCIVTYLVISYNSVSSENTQLIKDLDTLRAQLETAEKAKEKALVGLMVLEDSVKQTVRKVSPASDRKTKDVASKVTRPRPAATKAAKACHESCQGEDIRKTETGCHESCQGGSTRNTETGGRGLTAHTSREGENCDTRAACKDPSQTSRDLAGTR